MRFFLAGKVVQLTVSDQTAKVCGDSEHQNKLLTVTTTFLFVGENSSSDKNLYQL